MILGIYYLSQEPLTDKPAGLFCWCWCNWICFSFWSN
jgi:hypothetical protein